MARASAASFDIFRWARIVSTICSSMVSTGLRLVIGSWKIIAMSLAAQVADRRPRPASTRSWPSNMTRAALDPAGGLGSSRMIARLVTLLPQPDSPTSPRRSPSSTSKVTPLTAWIVASCVRNRTTRSSTDSRATLSA